MKLKLEFNAKSTSPSIQEAIQLAKKFNSTVDEKMLKVEVEELSEDFGNLIWKVAHLSKTSLFVDDVPIDSRGYKLREVLTCPKFKRCSGDCTLDSYGWDEITFRLGLRERGGNEEYVSKFDESVFDRFGKNIIVDISQDKFTINSDSLIEAYHKHFYLENLLCSKFKESKYLKDIRNFKKEPTFNITEEEDLFGISEESIEEYKIKQQQEQQEMINRIGDEVEQRLRKILNEFLNKL